MSKNPVAGLCPFNFTSQQLEQSLERILIAFFFQLFFVHFELLLFSQSDDLTVPSLAAAISWTSTLWAASGRWNIRGQTHERESSARSLTLTLAEREEKQFDCCIACCWPIVFEVHSLSDLYLIRRCPFSTCTRVRCSDVMYSVNQACPFRHDVIWSIFIWYYSWWSNRLSRGQLRSLFFYYYTTFSLIQIHAGIIYERK